MHKSLIIGITGGIGSGKTTFANILRKNGYFVYDSDVEAKKLQNENAVLRNKLIETFGADIYKSNELDRKKLASIVFGNPELLQKLNSIVHPAVLENFLHWKEFHTKEKCLFLESALLFESKFNLLTDKIILITASEHVRIKRVMKRDDISDEQVKLRIKNQQLDNDKYKLVDVIINTDEGSPSQNSMNEILSKLGV
ncbi:MAG TPA: dephospho-CoA kinase [Paludibacter sp.]|nr:dephospho-CoA kinase [Paludibacter sp.]